MNIKILDSFLREHLKTKATPKDIAKYLSLTSVSVEKLEKYGNDFLYEMEITTNRPDLFCVIGIAREASAILPQFGINAEFIPLKLSKPQINSEKNLIEINNNPKLVNRICAVVMDIEIGKSPKEIKERLEASDIRSLNNIIDITNYVMRVIGHPTHVFDFNRLGTTVLNIQEAKEGEKITTLDNKTYILKGKEIVAKNDKNEIVDLLGIMGLQNSVVNNATKRILFFINNNESTHIRNASMQLGIRTEAAVLNEKEIDPELAMDALMYGIELFQKLANGKVVSKIIDIYPNKSDVKKIKVSFEKINKVIGVEINPKKAIQALEDLGFKTTFNNNYLETTVPSFRNNDINIEEDIIEEIARIYGYHNLPSKLPEISGSEKIHTFVNDFYFEKRAKEALKYWGFTETYTYSFISEDMFEGPIENAVEIANPLTKDFIYMRNSLIPSLLNVAMENKSFEEIKIFEIANVYIKRQNNLPNEILTLSGILKSNKIDFYQTKGLVEQLLTDLGIKNLTFKKSQKGGMGTSLFIEKEYLGEIEILDTHLINFELNFELILKSANVKKIYKPFAKFPPIVEDITIISSENTTTSDLINCIKEQSNKIVDVSLKDTYQNSRTFHIIYQDFEQNLTNEKVKEIREKIIVSLNKNLGATVNN